MSLRTSPLFAEHQALGAKLVDFGGWQMPLSYRAGTIAEHLACRRATAIFDVSHLGTVRVEGADAYDRLQRGLSNDLGKIRPGRAQYTHMLNDQGGVLDDIIVWWISAERFDVMPNASNTARVLSFLGGSDVTSERAVVAVQGPTARELLGPIAPEAAAVPRFGVACFVFEGADCLAAGTGYTGEDGVECALPVRVAAAFWRAVIAAGAEPAGLGARDTLRLEAGLPLHGHELGPEITPLEAGLGWVVGWGKGPFRGRPALEELAASGGPSRHLVGLVTTDRRPPREGAAVTVRGEPAASGAVTSGNYSPILERGIALGLLPTGAVEGDTVEIDLRGRPMPAKIVKPPFHRLGRPPGAAGP
ncbi:MAG: glycine cleavage system aminomethyltransferase GcvT [Acidimicrobiales bacterium]